MLKIKVYGYELTQKFYTYFRHNYEANAFKYIEYNNTGLFIFEDYDPIEIIYENILKYYYNDNDFTIKIIPKTNRYIKVIIKSANYDKND